MPLGPVARAPRTNPRPPAPRLFAVQHSRNRDLDGVRGLAILLVVAAHSGLPVRWGGLSGVTLFFVLSGYLITSLLIREWDRWGSISLWRFWGRRAVRLLPALLLLLALTPLLLWATGDDRLSRLPRSGPLVAALRRQLGAHPGHRPRGVQPPVVALGRGAVLRHLAPALHRAHDAGGAPVPSRSCCRSRPSRRSTACGPAGLRSGSTSRPRRTPSHCCSASRSPSR